MSLREEHSQFQGGTGETLVLWGIAANLGFLNSMPLISTYEANRLRAHSYGGLVYSGSCRGALAVTSREDKTKSMSPYIMVGQPNLRSG